MNRAEMAVLMKGIAPVIRETITRTVQPLVDRLVAIEGREPEKGDKGEPGKDGFNLEDLDFEPVDERTIKLMFVRGEYAKSFELELPIPVYQGVYVADRFYKRGDVVTWGGSSFIAERETNAKPETTDSGWKCMVKRGRDGKDAK